MTIIGFAVYRSVYAGFEVLSHASFEGSQREVDMGSGHDGSFIVGKYDGLRALCLHGFGVHRCVYANDEKEYLLGMRLNLLSYSTDAR